MAAFLSTRAEIRLNRPRRPLAIFLSRAPDQTNLPRPRWLPRVAMRDPHIGDFALISCFVTSYLLTSTASADRSAIERPPRKAAMLILCLCVFMAVSALCALRPRHIALILGLRAVQG